MKALLLTAFVLCVTALVGVGAYWLGDEEEAVPRTLALSFLTLVVVGGITLLVVYVRGVTSSLQNLDITPDELAANEVLWAKTSGSMVHFKSGTALKFWEGVGGKLFLTSHVLEFQAHAGQPWVYRIIIPLSEIRRARPVRILGLFPGALRVEREDGSFELFNFGAPFDRSREWAEAIMEFRDDLEEDAAGE